MRTYLFRYTERKNGRPRLKQLNRMENDQHAFKEIAKFLRDNPGYELVPRSISMTEERKVADPSNIMDYLDHVTIQGGSRHDQTSS